MDHLEKAVKRLSHEDYTVGWICPLEVEQVAAVEMLDEEHEQLPQPANDHNVYSLGSINGHNVVIAGLPSAGNNPAATVVTQMRNTFAELRFGLLVGIGGGVPVCTDSGPIRLGHVVVSKPAGEHSGAVQYDHGKAEAGQFRRTGFLAPPPTVLLNAAQHLAVGRARSRADPLLAHLSRIDTTIRGLRRYKYPGADKDNLYRAEYVHPEPKVSCHKCGCDASQRVDRRSDDSDDEGEADDQEIVVHRGTIAAGELVVKDGLLRDKLAEQYGILCFEMEAAGALADFPCLVIRGISDYSDSHKNDKWHGYAAAVAAAYARQLFFHMPVDEVKKCKIAESDVQHLIVETDILARDSRDGNVRHWLNPPDPSSNYNEALSKRHTGSGRWLLANDPLYRQWKRAPKSLLWLHGIPGCGKTILCASVLEDLKGAEQPSHVVLCFFFDFRDKAKQSLDGMLRSLVAQLYQFSEASQSHVRDAFSAHSDGNRQPSKETLAKILWEMIREVKDVKIVLDALDECENRKELLRWLESIPELGEDLHVLMTSRKEEDIAGSLSQWVSPASIIHIETSDITDDIREYVQSRVRTSDGLKRWRSRPDIQNLIETTLMAKAHGMFRWAVCQLDVLDDCFTLPSLRSSLAALPESLDETYHRILAKIPRIHREDCIRILQLLAYSRRPFNVKELADALAVELGRQPPFDPENRMPDPMEITRLCPSLVSATPFPSMTTNKPSFPKLQLAHFSVKEYLTSNRVSDDFKHHLTELSARAAIVEISLAYLSCVEMQKYSEQEYDGEDDDEESDEEDDYREDDHPFPFLLHSLNWMDHAVVAEPLNEHLSETIIEFVNNGRLYWFWALWEDKILMGSASVSSPTLRISVPPLYWPATRGLIRCVRQLIKGGANVNGNEHFECPYRPIVGACESGHKDVVRLLLDNGADIDARGGHSNSVAVFAALQGNDHDFALELLERGANPEGKGNIYEHEFECPVPYLAVECPVLYLAASKGAVKVVKALLNKGADINLRCGYGATALTVAAEQGHQAVVQLLLRKGADINALGGNEHDNALAAACSEGHWVIARLLIDNGADVNGPGGCYSNPLVSASQNGHENTVQFLIEAGANVNATSRFRLSKENFLIQSSTGSIKKIVRGPLRRTKILHLETDTLESESVLITAASNFHSGVVKMLLDNGADPNIRDSNGTSALASFFHHHPPAQNETIPLILIDKGADLGGQHQKDFFLLLSCQKNYPGVTRLLLDNGANVESIARTSHCIPHFRGRRVYKHLVEGEIELRTAASDEESENRAENDEQRKVEDVFEYDVDSEGNIGVAREGRHYGSTLHIASSRGFVDIVTLLLDHGADPNRLDWHGWSPALIAAKYGHIRVCEKLPQGRSIEGHGKSSCLPPSQFTNRRLLRYKRVFWADHPFPANYLQPYFEIKVIAKKGLRCLLSIGVCCEEYPDPIEGPCHTKYHMWTCAYDGTLPEQYDRSTAVSYRLEVDIDDVIGCGLDYKANMMFYYRNNEVLGCASKIPVGRLFPALILEGEWVKVRVNFNATLPTQADWMINFDELKLGCRRILIKGYSELIAAARSRLKMHESYQIPEQ